MFEGKRYGVSDGRANAVCKANRRSLLVNNDWDTEQPSGQAGRNGNISTSRKENIRLKCLQNPVGIE